MATFYFVVFAVGFALSVLSFLGGAGHWGGHHGFGGNGADGTSGHGGDGMPILNFATATAFMTWFGGVGFLLTAHSAVVALATVVIAAVGGVAGAGVVL